VTELNQPISVINNETFHVSFRMTSMPFLLIAQSPQGLS